MDFDDLLSKENNSYKHSSGLEPEDILLDSREGFTSNVFGVDNKKQVWILFGAIIFVMIMFFARSFYLQVVKGDYYEALALDNKVKLAYSKAKRGIIYDISGETLVKNSPAFNLVIDPGEFPKNKDEREVIIQELSRILEKPEPDIKNDIETVDFSLKETQIIEENLEHPKAIVFQSRSGSFKGVRTEISAIRDYVDANYFSHILGYTGKLTKEEYEKKEGYLLNDTIGKNGLENIYESELRGVYGIDRLEVDSNGNIKRSLVGQESTPGNSLFLTIDKGLQMKLQDSLTEMLNKLELKRASAVAIDPRDGSVRALVSLPSFDNNLFSRGISQNDYSGLLNDPDRPLFNRAIAGEYPPGSTIKPLIAAAALEEKIITPSRQISDSGSIIITNPYNPANSAVFNDWKAHGSVNLKKAIAESCNVYFYTVGGGYGDIDGLGIERIKKYSESFGLNKLTNIDLPSERNGLIPDVKWKEKNISDKWYVGDTYNSSIGQGYVTVTPLQLANYIAAVANGGIVYQPHLLDKVLDETGGVVKEFGSIVMSKDFISPKNIKSVQEGMRETVLSGSGRQLSGLVDKSGNPVAAAGKTGTAQFKKDTTHAWFVTYAPYENPKLALIVLVEEGGEGHDAAVPVAKETLEWYFGR